MNRKVLEPRPSGCIPATWDEFNIPRGSAEWTRKTTATKRGHAWRDVPRVCRGAKGDAEKLASSQGTGDGLTPPAKCCAPASSIPHISMVVNTASRRSLDLCSVP